MSHNPSIAKFKYDFENLDGIVDAHNNRFKDDKLREHKAFSIPFSHILSTTSRSVRLCRRSRIAWW